MLVLAALLLHPRTLTVGVDKQYDRIETAVAAASPGDTIQVFPSPNDYVETAVRVTKPNLTIVGIGPSRPVIDGDGGDYSGVGSIPRAIFQFDPGADGCKVEHLELENAHNSSSNGAGCRINQASHVTIEDCDIHGNDMGIMSNGKEGDPHAAERQLIERCHVHGNGSFKDPGYNHNLYLGGTSVRVDQCEIDHSLTGHNLKSRAGMTDVTYCYIHDSANREVDLVESWDTEQAASRATIVGSVIVKDRNCPGNRAVINFGQEKGLRVGRLFLLNDTIVTPFASAVLILSSPKVSAEFGNDVICNTSQASPELLQCINGASPDRAGGACNWISMGYRLDGTSIQTDSRYQGATWQDSSGFLPGGYVLGEAAEKFKTAIYPVQAPKTDFMPTRRYLGGGKWGPIGNKGNGGKPTFIGAG